MENNENKERQSAPIERIKQLLKESGYTQKDTAQAMGTSLMNIKKTLNSSSMTTSNLQKYADLLGVPLWQLFVSPEEVIARYGHKLPTSSPQACPKSAPSSPQADAEREKYLTDVIDSLKETISAQAKTIAVLSERVEQLEARLK